MSRQSRQQVTATLIEEGEEAVGDRWCVCVCVCLSERERLMELQEVVTVRVCMA